MNPILHQSLVFFLLLMANHAFADDKRGPPAQISPEIPERAGNPFVIMCTSEFLDSPLEQSDDVITRSYGRYNPKTKMCTQTYPMSVEQGQAEHFCRKAMPYYVESVVVKDGSVTCTWDNKNPCPSGYIQIYEKCYKTRDRECNKNERLSSPFNEDHVRWLSRLARLEPYFSGPVVVKINRILESKKVHKDKYYERGSFHKPKDSNHLDSFPWTMNRLPNSIYELKPGDIIRAKPDHLLCELKISGSVSSAGPEKPIYGNSKESKELSTGSRNSRGTIKLSKGTAFVTRNDYLPKLLTDSSVDNTHFHKICNSICPKCSAASGTLLTEIGKSRSLPMGRYHVPMSREGSDSGSSKECNPAFKALNRRKFRYISQYDVSKDFIPKDEQWFEQDGVKYPSNQCADGERIAAQFFQGNGVFGVVDAPVFDWRPIICYDGVVTEQPEVGECFKNSEMKNGKCECKNGFTEGLDSELASLIIRNGYDTKGYICLASPKCHAMDKKANAYKGFFFLGDGSGSMKGERWEKVRPFVQKFKGMLVNNEIPVWLYQWSSPRDYSPSNKNEGWYCERNNNCPTKNMEYLAPGWTNEAFDQAVEDVFAKLQDGWTIPYYYIHLVSQHWSEYRRKHGLKDEDRALVVMVTDGETGETSIHQITPSNYNFYDSAVGEFNNAKLKFWGVQVGGGPNDMRHFQRIMDDGEFKVIHVEDEGLNDKLVKKIQESVCVTRVEQDFLDAI